jgi:integrase
VADDEWRSMILFGLYTGQRLSDIASLRWSNIDLPRGELPLVTRKTGKTMILPIAAPLRRLLESLQATDNPNAPIHTRGIRDSRKTRQKR